MMEVRSDGTTANVVARIGSQPIVLAAATLVIMVLGIGSITLWRAYTGTSPEQERAASARLTTESPESVVPNSSSSFFMKLFTSFACGPAGARVR